MKYKIIIWVLVILLLVNTVLGYTQQFYDDFDNSNFTSEGWSQTLGTTEETASYIHSSTDASSDITQNFSSYFGFNSTDWQIDIMAKGGSSSNYVQFMIAGDNGHLPTNRVTMWLTEDTNNYIECQGSCVCNAVAGEAHGADWYAYTYYYNYTNATLQVYRNGTLKGSTVISGCDFNEYLTMFHMRRSDSYVDYINISAVSLSTTTDIDFTITDSFNGSNIDTFSINLTWANGTSEIHSTTNGTIPLRNVSNSDTTINVSYYGMTDYFNTSLENQVITANSSNTITTTTYQSILYLTSKEKISNSSVSGATYYVGTNSTTSRFNITAATHSIIFTHPGYYNLTDSVTTTALTTTNHTITGVYSSVVNITAKQSNGTSLTNWNINITSLNYTSWVGENGSTTNGTYWFNAINGTYQAIINSSEGTETFTFVVDASLENVTYQYFSMDNCSDYTQVVLNFTILEEAGETLLNDSAMNLWVNVSGTNIIGYQEFNLSWAYDNYYTVCIPNNSLTSWVVNAQAEYSNLPTYDEKNYFLVNYSLTNTTTDINLYLTNGTTQVTLRLRDYNDDPIEDAYIKVLSYDLGTNSYITTEIVNTDSSGDAYAQIILNTQFYAFLVEYQGEVILQTLPTKLTTTSLTLRANLDTDYFASYDVSEGVTTDLTFNNATVTFTYTFSDPTGSIARGCLKLTRRSINGDTLLNTSCVTSTASTILMTIPGAVGTNTYIANGYITISGDDFQTDTLSHSYNNTYRTFGLSGVFFAFLIVLVLSLAGLWHPVASIVLMVLGFIITNVMGIYYLNWSYLITVVILAGITIYRVGKSD